MKLSILLFSLATCVHAETNTYGELQGWSFSIEQDLFYLIDTSKNEDRDYTIGIDFGVYGETATVSPLHKGLKAVDSVLGLVRDSNQYDKQRILHMGVKVYTPDDLSNPAPIYDDRPYASLIYLSNKVAAIAPHRKSGTSTELTLGVLGLDIAEEVQTFTHKLQREVSNSDTPEEPRGWDHQVSDGGELTFKYRVDYKHIITRTSWSDLSYSLEGNIGYETNAGIGLLWRIGQRASHFAYFEPNPAYGVSSNKTRLDNYVYLYLKSSGVIYNALLQGGIRESDVTFSSDQIERNVNYAGIGWTMTLETGTRLTFAQHMHTEEFKGPNARKHYWGGFYLSFPFASN